MKILIICLMSIGLSQTRYIDEVFEEVIITEDVVYGNAPDLPFWFFVESNTVDIDLDMDIYEPLGDMIEDRPVIVFIHTGHSSQDIMNWMMSLIYLLIQQKEAM